MKKNVILIVLIIGVIVAITWSAYRFWDITMQGAPEKIQEITSFKEATTSSTLPEIKNEVKNMEHLITIETNYGEIQFSTYDTDAPKTVENFVTLVGKGFYNNLIFHRVIKGFMIQGGDPNGNGTGGPGYQFADELNPATESYKNGYKKGVVAMANAGPNTNGSQFFIMLANYPLPNNYTIFGKVTKGQEIVDMIGDVKTNENDKPLENVIMKSVSARLVE